MCELFGFSSSRETNITKYLIEFFTHSTEHPNGWGLAEFSDGKTVLHTEPVCALESVLLPELMKKEIFSKAVMAHIRKATVGGIKPENCHPFFMTDAGGNCWTLMHNGTIFSGRELIPYTLKQSGDTDSERILLYLIDKINMAEEKKNAALNSFERFGIVEQMISELSYRNKLNLIIYDTEYLYVHVNMENTLFYQTTGGGICFATSPLNDEQWEHVPMTTLLVYQDGRLKYRGKNHHNKYVDLMSAAGAAYSYDI